MPEQALVLHTGSISLEARYAPGSRGEVMILCHPHPEYGGCMDNNVVLAAREALSAQGFGTLRFNFRGVGRSGGRYAQGVGEAEDLAWIAKDLADREPVTVHVAAYSFGAWVALRALKNGMQPASLLLFSPPVDFMPFDDLCPPDAPCLITLGDRDEYCAVSSLEDWLGKHPGARPHPTVLPGGDHFYRGQEAALKKVITRFVGPD